MARLPFLKRDESEEELSQPVRNRKLITQLIFRLVFLFMFVIAVIFGGISMILGSSLFIPRSAEGVLKSVEMPSFYAWTSESIREVNLIGSPERQDAIRSASVDTESGKYQLQVIGVLPDRAIYVSDGSYVVRLTESAQDSTESSTSFTESPFQLVTDHCHRTPDPDDDSTIPVSTVTMPTADQLLAASPVIDTDDGTVLGQRAWIIDFKLTPEIVKQLMWLDFFDRALDANPGERPWVISTAEREAIENGEYKAEYAKVWVTRDEPRVITQIDTTFTVDPEGAAPASKYRLLAQIVPSVTAAGGEEGLNQINLGEGCGSAGSFAPEESEPLPLPTTPESTTTTTAPSTTTPESSTTPLTTP